jgi:Domain of unknown function (DUF4429)/Protein of unknown function (DUF2510)/Short C-terminal domain
MSNAAAGWYPQPDGQQRYWDGELWTEHFAPGGQAPNPALTAAGGTVEVKGQNGTIVFDADFVTITRTGFFARATVGKGEKRIPVASITAIQWKPAGLVNGFIQFTLGGGNEARSKFGHQTTDAAKDENSVVFVKKQMPAFQALREQIEDVIAQRGRPASVAPVASGPLDQLKQLSELRDAGIVTEEEFTAKKGVDLGSDVGRLTERRRALIDRGRALFAVGL